MECPIVIGKTTELVNKRKLPITMHFISDKFTYILFISFLIFSNIDLITPDQFSKAIKLVATIQSTFIYHSLAIHCLFLICSSLSNSIFEKGIN